MSRPRSIVLAYTLFAVLALLMNIAAQDLVMQLYAGPFAIFLSMVCGTGVGLLVKYHLDKRYIFRFQTRSLAHDGQTFALYSLMGLATTAIFWAFELVFHHVFGTAEMRYLGAAIGLAIGYLTKYNLDKRYVFQRDAR